MGTKNKILARALEMFNESGVEKITTRHIAAELEMSQGNLHYHYPNKNMIIQTLFDQFMDEIKGAEKYTGEVFNKEVVVTSMRENYVIMFKYCLFFKDNEVIWRRLPEIKTRLIELFEVKRGQLKGIIEMYKQGNIFRKEISDEQINFLLDQFIFTISTWLTASSYLGPTEDSATYFADYTFRLWLPYLIESEMNAWENLLSQ